jgi:chorismate mutase / prephenate dehydratase
MEQEIQSLDELRREIDRIDDQLHDLLMLRAEVSQTVAAVKQPQLDAITGLARAMRPAREAAILRRLLARHRGDLPPIVVVRIWREIIAASLRVQSKFQLHVYAGEAQSGLVDLARGHFGSLTPIRTHTRASQVVHACAEDPDSLGVVPIPELEEPGAAWWAQLAPSGERGPRVIAKLPFLAADEDAPFAYAIGAVEQEPSGDDTSLLVLEIPAGMSRTKLSGLFKEAGFRARVAAAGRISEKNVPDEILVEVQGFVASDDPRFGALAGAAGEAIARIASVGGYANPAILSKAPR